MSKLITFTYTKADSSVSQRVLAVEKHPTKFYSGMDISELSKEDQALFMAEYSELQADYNDKLAIIVGRFDANFRYRQFDPSRMTDVVEETI